MQAGIDLLGQWLLSHVRIIVIWKKVEKRYETNARISYNRSMNQNKGAGKLMRVMIAGALGGMIALMYLWAQSGAIYTKVQSEEVNQQAGLLCVEEKKADATKGQIERFNYLTKALCEIEKNIRNIQFSLRETADGYELILYDREKREVFSEVYPMKPWVKEVSEGILEIGISTGSPARYTFYFRKEDAKISDTFYNAKLFGGRCIAHRPMVGDQWDEPLILTDIFEEGILYQEIYRDFSVTADLMSAIYSIELTDEEHIMLEYCVGEDYTVVSEVVEIELGE